MAIVFQQGPTQGSPMSCSHSQLSPTQVQPGPSEPRQTPPPHSLVQDYTTETQLDRPCSTDSIITQPQHSPPQIGLSPLPCSPAQVGTSHPQSPTQDSKPTLEQESPGSNSPVQLRCRAAQDISTLDQDLSPVYCRSTLIARRHASLKPISAPCSPSPAPPRATQCSLSQPASPVQAHSLQPVGPSQLSLFSSQLATQSGVTKECPQTSTTELKSSEYSPMQLSPNHDSQTLERSPAPFSPTSNLSSMPLDGQDTEGKLPNQLSPVQSSALSLDHSSPLHVPPMPTPDSLVHKSTSKEHSSLTCSPSANEMEKIPPPASHIHQSPCDSPLRCTEANDLIQNSSAGSSPEHTSQMPTSPASSLLACASPMPMEPSPAHVGYTGQRNSPLAPPVRSSVQRASPLHPMSCHNEEMEVAVDHPRHFIESETSPSHPNSTPDSLDHASPVHTEAKSVNALMGSVHAQERTSPPVCSFAEFTQTSQSQSPTHPGQSSPTHVQSTCSPSQSSPGQRSPLPAPTSFSPLHCRPTDTSSASCSVSHSLSHGGQTTSCFASITDVSIIHSPPRSSHAGQASPVHVQSTSSSAHSCPVLSQTPSSTYSRLVHATVACVSPSHSPAQASETYRSPHYSPAPDSGISSGPSVASSSLDADIVASSIMQSSVLSGVVQLESGLVKPTDSIRQTSPPPASSLPDDSSLVGPNRASLSQVSESPASLHIPDKSAVENQPSTAPESPLHQRSATPVDATSTPASPSHDSPVHCSPTQDNTAMPSTSHTSETSATPPPSAPSQVSPTQTFSPHAPQAQASSAHSSPVASPVCVSLDCKGTQTTLVNPSPVYTSPVQPEASTSPGPDSPMRCEASPCPDTVSPVQPDAGPGSPQQHTQTERESSATVGEYQGNQRMSHM